jgi:class 3 adenylate cyclase/tetratricopeptide (TPR) repeat protein
MGTEARHSDLDVSSPTRTLVGRVRESQWLLDRLADAERGKPQVVIVRGEMGIGKSRLTRNLLEAASQQGITTSLGRFREDAAAPFEAFTGDFFQKLAGATDAVVRTASSESILRSLATFGAGDAAGATSTEAQRIAAVHDGFAALVTREPFAFLVDDVQWADTTSREWLLSLVRFAADLSMRAATHLLMVLVVRDEPGVPEIPELDLIRREDITSCLTLHGLNELEVSRLTRSVGAGHIPQTTVRDIARVTRGNPLFAIALAKQAEAVVVEELPDRAHAARQLPSEIQDLMRRRIAALSDECQGTLTLAAVLGQGWTLDELAAVSGLDTGSLRDQLDEAERAEVLVAIASTYEFAHPLYERATLQALGSRRLRQTHRAIAEALIGRVTGNADESKLRIAHHLVEAGEDADPTHLVEYCPRAGSTAFAAFAWQDAARYFEAAVHAWKHTAPLDHDLAALALRASAARLNNGEPEAALRNADIAIAASDSDSPIDVALAWNAHVRAELFRATHGEPINFGPLEELMPELERSAPEVAANTYTTLASVYANANRQIDEARLACRRAIDLGTRCGEHAACAAAWGQLAVTQWMRLELTDALESLDAEEHHAVEAGDRARLAHAVTLKPLLSAWLGRFDDATAAADVARLKTRELGYSLNDGFPLAADAVVAIARGMYAASDSAIDDALEVSRLNAYQWPTALITPLLATSKVVRGDGEGTEAILEDWAPAGAPADRRAFRWLLQHYAGTTPGGLEVEELASIWHQFSARPRVSSDAVAALVIEIAANTGAVDLVRDAAQFLELLHARGQLFTTTMCLFIPRVLGIAAAAQGERERARHELERSIAIAAPLRAHAELAMCDYALAVVLAQDGAEEEAGPLVERAHRAALALGMSPLARQCVDLALTLEVPLSFAATRVEQGTKTDVEGPALAVVMFTDIVNSVGLTESLGDWVFHDRSRALQTSLREAIRRHGGAPVEGIKLGDGILAEFTSGERAVSCAIECSAIGSNAGLPLHIGVHAGDVIRSDGDIFGGTVNTAARICGEAPAGTVLVSQTIRDLARTSSSLQYADIGPRVLRGISEPVSLFAVHATP